MANTLYFPNGTHEVLKQILIECDFLDFALSQTRVDRKECQKAVNKIRKVIGEVV